MKLRYYLRGLGIGILVTAFIMSVARGDGKGMSDAEVRARAAELGMVDADSLVLSSLPQGESEGQEQDGNVIPSDGAAGPESPEPSTSPDGRGDADVSMLPDGRGDADVSMPPDGRGDADASTAPDSRENSDMSTAPDAQGNADASEESGAADVEVVRLTIKNGSGSEAVSRDLALAGLVESAGDFDAFLCNNGYSQRLRAGTYEIPVGAGEEEIAKMITGG